MPMCDLTLLEQEQLDEFFTHHPPQGDQQQRYVAIRSAARAFAEVLMTNAPRCADRTTAVRTLRESVMWANAAIALEKVEVVP